VAVAIAVLCIGVGTYLMRLSFIALSGRYELPPLVQRALRYVPPSVLTALIVPDLVGQGGAVSLSLGSARLVAGVVAIVVAWRSRNVFLTLIAGMVVLWLLLLLTPVHA
jgi:branched-subunit amino acid transport protein